MSTAVAEIENEVGSEPTNENQTKTSNTSTLINRDSLQRELLNAAVEIGDDDLAKLTEDQASELWDWMEKFDEAVSEVESEASVWFGQFPGFMEWVGEPTGEEKEIRRIQLKHDESSSAATETETQAGTAATEAPPADDELTVAKKSLARISAASDHANILRGRLEEAEDDAREAKGREKSCREVLDKAEKELSRVIADVKSGQQVMEFDDDVSITCLGPTSEYQVTAAEPSQDWMISELNAKAIKKLVGADAMEAAKEQDDPIGLSESQLDKFEQVDVKTICGLEKFMREDAFWHQKIKGFGDAAIQRVISTLTAFRKVNPQAAAEVVK